jgi:hypothetical protein
MTGLTRKEVRRLRDKIEKGERSVVVKTTPLCEVLHRWHAEDEYLSQSGEPEALPFSGERGSFSSLVKKYGGDIPPGAMRTELKRVSAIEEDADGTLRVTRRYVHPVGIEEKLIQLLMYSAYPLLSNISHNVDSANSSETWPQYTAFTQSVRKTDLARIRRVSADRLRETAESFDDLFIAYEALHESDQSDSDKGMLAIGVFYFEDRNGTQRLT